MCAPLSVALPILPLVIVCRVLNDYCRLRLCFVCASAPPDEIFNTGIRFRADTDKRKVNLGVGQFSRSTPWSTHTLRTRTRTREHMHTAVKQCAHTRLR